ncbi:MAG: SRPBCC domain-containing protein, partial [Bacteroidia bacterium]
METENLLAKAEIKIDAPLEKVWDALINPEKIKKYMFGSTVTSNFTEGSKIVFSGEWNGKAFREKGKILKLEPEKLLQYDSYNANSGKPDTEENYHTI